MDIQNTKKWGYFGWGQQLTGTLSITLLAFGIRQTLHPLIQPYGVFHFFIVAVLLIQFLYGYRMSILAIVISLALGEVFFVAPYGEFSHLNDKDLIISLNFVLVILPAIFLMEKLQRSLYARELMAQVNDSRMLVALRRENDRIYYGKKVDLSGELIDCMLSHFDQLLFVKADGHAVMRGPAFFSLHPSTSTAPAFWFESIQQQDWEEINRPLSAPDWQSRRWERDFHITLNGPLGRQIVQGKVLCFQIHEHHIELWVHQPAND